MDKYHLLLIAIAVSIVAVAAHLLIITIWKTIELTFKILRYVGKN